MAYNVLASVNRTNPEDDETRCGWARDSLSRLQPLAPGAAYVGYLGGEPEDRDRLVPLA